MTQETAPSATPNAVDDILNNATVAIFVMDAGHRCTYMNPAAEALTGFAAAEMYGRVLHEVIHHTRRDGSPYPLQDCPIGCSLLIGDRARGEEVFVHRDGTFLDVAYAASLIHRDGEVAGAVLEVQDITAQVGARDALRRSEAALRQADRRKDEFLAMLAHELRNPLAPISTAAELLQRSPGVPSLVLDASSIIARQARHMADLVGDLLDVSRVTRGQVQLDLQPIDIRDAARAAVEQARPLIEARRHSFSMRIAPEALCVHGDHTRLVQSIANLLNNAAKYTPPGGVLEIEVSGDARNAAIAVTDNGVGIEPALLPQVFDLFTQGERSLDRSQGGLGIGLALVRSLVALHGGTVAAHSPGVNRGSRFTITLPLHAGAPVATAGPPGDRGPGGAVASLQIALVDDNPDALQTLALLLRSQGHHADAFATAATALAAAATGRYDAYVLDIGLPDRSGYELAHELRRLPAARDALLVALTGYGRSSDARAALAAGFDAHFVKPVEPAGLLAALARAGRGGHAPVITDG